ncbi:uncharacterized protein [Spinacia oleracea]|uniref:Reverse transcriptase zinc-binding domain-containing protein n=1 Tax=Spinacia oleracea TaxID=3562 RepID=A0ABM3QRK3_SPIOL|nr:uncharacterized protein LOC130461795 [Spinacia oleracea]
MSLDKLLNWKVVATETCLLCGLSGESVEHMFFQCHVSAQLWHKVLNFLHFDREATGFTAKLTWMIKSSKRGVGRHKLLIMFFAESIYSLWLNRDDKLFNHHCKAPDLFRETLFRAVARASNELSNMLID